MRFIPLRVEADWSRCSLSISILGNTTIAMITTSLFACSLEVSLTRGKKFTMFKHSTTRKRESTLYLGPVFLLDLLDYVDCVCVDFMAALISCFLVVCIRSIDEF